MDDIKYEYITDIKNKKIAARGAKHRNVKHRRVTLPNDNLTNKEWKKMNGELKEIVLNERYTWKELKEYDIRIVADYLDHLVRRFGCNNDDLSTCLDVSSVTFHRIKNKIKSEIGREILHGKRHGVKAMDLPVQSDWDNFINPKRQIIL